MSTAVLQRQVPWVPGPDDPPQAAATSGDPGSGESFTVPAAYLFRHECHYNVFDIAEIANLPLEVVQGAAARKEISLVCTESSRGKSWPGHAIAGWIERSGHECSVPRNVYEQWRADTQAQVAAAERDRQRAETERENRQRPIRFYREVVERSPVLRDVLTVLLTAEQAGHSVGDVLKLLDTPATKT